ncbi:hypothetical protein RIR_jg4001.t1 [Rhizophagus irregularis DAOM 181602=DAOM 197198]|nr:hypothetical protein RIR_jg4001.t1 [Rhizophagus irregularis DAOM 181602=DAOM 197198]
MKLFISRGTVPFSGICNSSAERGQGSKFFLSNFFMNSTILGGEESMKEMKAMKAMKGNNSFYIKENFSMILVRFFCKSSNEKMGEEKICDRNIRVFL